MILIQPRPEDLARFRDLPESLIWALERMISTTAGETAAFMKQELARQKLAATSLLINSVNAQPVDSMTWTVGPRAAHGRWVFEGRRSGGTLPPIGAIQDWVRVRRLGDPRIAWAIARKIQQRGIPPRDYLSPTIAFAQQRLLLHSQNLLPEER